MALSGLELALAIKERRFPAGLAPWAEHMRVHEENLVAIVEPGRIVSHWTPGRQFTVNDGYVQGGLLCALADGGQWLCIASTADTIEPWVTLDLHTRFLRPIRGGERVEIESRLLNRSRTSAIAETTFTLGDGKLAAKITGGWRKSESRNAAETAPQS